MLTQEEIGVLVRCVVEAETQIFQKSVAAQITALMKRGWGSRYEDPKAEDFFKGVWVLARGGYDAPDFDSAWVEEWVRTREDLGRLALGGADLARLIQNVLAQEREA